MAYLMFPADFDSANYPPVPSLSGTDGSFIVAPPDASDNDSFESFCLTSTLPEFEYVTGNWGTPRKANDC